MKLTDIEQQEFSRYLEHYDLSQYMKGKTFLITGCKGIVGTGVIKWLLLANKIYQANIRIIASTRTPEDMPAYIEEGDKIRFCSFGQEREICRECGVDYIIHAASPTGNSFHAAHPAQSLRVIVDETEKMLDICRKHSKCSMLYISSEEIYGLPDTEKPLPETYVGAIDSLTYRSCYPLGKKAAELLCYNYCLEYGTDVKIIRPTVIHGLLQKYSEERVVNEILRCVIENRNLVLKSAGTTKKCLMYSLDAISAIFIVLFRGKKGEAYNASNPDTFMAVKDLANHIFKHFCPELKVEYPKIETATAEGYLPKRSLLQDIGKIKRLGWEPITGLDMIYQIDLQRFMSVTDA